MRFPEDLQPGDTLLYARKGIFGWIISLRSNSRLTHVECYEGRGMSVASRDGKGVNRYPFRREGLAHVLRPTRPFNLPRATRWFETQRGAGYGWADLLNFVLPSVIIDTDGYFCSEFAIAYLRHGDLEVGNREPAVKISPRDFRLFDVLQEVWPEDTRVQPDEAA